MARLLAALGFGRYPGVPPGDLVDLENLERSNRRILVKLSKKHGPVFKINEENHPQICVIGVERGRALMRDHANRLQPVNIDITPIVEGGFMRHMSGDAHKSYRSALIGAIMTVDMTTARQDCEDIVRHALREYEQALAPCDDGPLALHDALSIISTGFLIRLFFGMTPEQDVFTTVAELFRKLGPHGVVWNIGDVQKHAFSAIADRLNSHLSDKSEVNVDNVLSSVAESGKLDATMLGNLIYMVEIGRYDMAGLFKWICQKAAVSSEYIGQIRDAADGKIARDLARAFVLETLRMDQSERLIRRVNDEFIFEGFRFPKDWRVRVCMWESHKLGENFEDPFEFNPSRFLKSAPSPNIYSPFGLDHHQCPLSSISVALGVQFLLTLVRDYDVTAVNDGPSVRGPYHWEPPVGFFVRLRPTVWHGHV
jgi:cytochrome P450